MRRIDLRVAEGFAREEGQRNTRNGVGNDFPFRGKPLADLGARRGGQCRHGKEEEEEGEEGERGGAAGGCPRVAARGGGVVVGHGVGLSEEGGGGGVGCAWERWGWGGVPEWVFEVEDGGGG